MENQHLNKTTKLKCPLWPACRNVHKCDGTYSSVINLRAHFREHHRNQTLNEEAIEEVQIVQIPQIHIVAASDNRPAEAPTDVADVIDDDCVDTAIEPLHQEQVPVVVASSGARQTISATDSVTDQVEVDCAPGHDEPAQLNDFDFAAKTGNCPSADESEYSSSDITANESIVDGSGSDRGGTITRKFNLGKYMSSTHSAVSNSDVMSGRSIADALVHKDFSHEQLDMADTDEMSGAINSDEMEHVYPYMIDGYNTDEMSGESNADAMVELDSSHDQYDYNIDEMSCESNADGMGHGDFADVDNRVAYVNEAIEAVHLAGILPGIHIQFIPIHSIAHFP